MYKLTIYTLEEYHYKHIHLAIKELQKRFQLKNFDNYTFKQGKTILSGKEGNSTFEISVYKEL